MLNFWPFTSRKAETTPARRAFAAAQLSRHISFMRSLEVAHQERLRDIANLRAHSRDLTNNNVYAARYRGMVSTHLVGPEGINFESEIFGANGKPKDAWNDAIESEFAAWGACCTADASLGWVEAQQQAAETTAVDGEILVRLVRGYPNRWGFAIEHLDADRLDHTYSATLTNGNRIVGGVELDRWGRRVAYHIWTAHPSDYDARPVREAVPADQILHLRREDRTQGVRGIPWITPAMVQINMVGRLWTAELTAANADANRLGVIKGQSGSPVEEVEDAHATATEITSDFATFFGLDAGQDVVFPPSNHPNSVLPQFTSYLLKGVASGLNVSYHSISGDLSESKFSSDRTALVDERRGWRKLQGWFIRSYCNPIYRAWLEMAILSGAVSVPAPLERICAPRWTPETWDWVDPRADVEASIDAITFGLSTYQEELGKRGKDWSETFAQRALEQARAKELGLVLGDPQAAPAPPVKEEKPDGQDA